MRMTMRALLVDDEAPARSELRYLLGAHPGSRSSEAASAAEALELSRDAALRRRLPRRRDAGPDRARRCAARRASARDPPAVVFVTAHAEYAVEAFAVEAFDYLLKPVDPERLARVVERLRERVGRERRRLSRRSRSSRAAAPS